MAHVLIVDDEPDGCAAVAEYLRKTKHDVRCVSSGRAAMAALVDHVPDAILLDLLMPGMDGFELLEAIRGYLRWVTVPVAVLTAYPEHPRLRHLATHGVTRIFTKSHVNLDAILEWVNAQPLRSPPPPNDDRPGAAQGV